MLSNKASGHFVDANGILIVPQGAGVVKSPISVPITSVPLGLTVTPTVGATTQSKTPSTTASATPATVVINGVSAPSAVRVVYNQGTPASATTTPASLIDVALSQLDKASAKKLPA